MLDLPDEFRRNILENFQDGGAAWLDALPGLITTFEDRWGIRAGEPFKLTYNYVAPAQRADGKAVVLKLGVPCMDFTLQAQGLAAFDGHGMVRLLEADIEAGAMLLERLLPGKTLVEEARDDEEATRITARVMQAMWVPAPAAEEHKRVQRWLVNFQKIRAKYAGGECPLSWKTVDRTERLAAELFRSAGRLYLLHGDLHHFNILSVEEPGGLGWRAIDPFGVAGEREMEPAAMLRNPYLNPPVDAAMRKMLDRRMAIFEEMLGFDRQRMTAWAAVYCAVSAWWTLAVDGDGWQLDAEMAEYFFGLM